MKYSETKMVDNEVVRVTIELNVSSNGWASFDVSTDWFDRNVRRNEEKILFNKKNYYLSGCGGVNKDIIEEHFPHLNKFIWLAGKDIFGMDSYPIMNMIHYLNENEKGFIHACNELNITVKQGNEIKKYSEFHFGEFLKTHIDEVTKPLADEGILLLEQLTDKNYIPTDVISAELFNDLHYCLVTKEKGWNVYKDLEDKKSLNYSMINLDNSIK